MGLEQQEPYLDYWWTDGIPIQKTTYIPQNPQAKIVQKVAQKIRQDHQKR